MAARFGPVGRNMVRWKEWAVDACPHCGTREPTRHVWQCSADAPTNLKRKHMERIDEWMYSMQTDPGIRQAILYFISQWIGVPQYVFPTNTRILNLCFRQAEAGWGLALTGMWLKDWVQYQDLFYKKVNSRRSGHLWLSRLIRKLWDLQWDLWTLRNSVLHDNKATKEHLESVAQVTDLFDKKSTEPRFLHVLLRNQKTVLDLKPEQIKAWLKRYKTYKTIGYIPSRVSSETMRGRVLKGLRRRHILRTTHPSPTHQQQRMLQELRNYRLHQARRISMTHNRQPTTLSS